MNNKYLAIRLCQEVPTWFSAPVSWHLAEPSIFINLHEELQSNIEESTKALVILWINDKEFDENKLLVMLDSTARLGIPRSVVTNDVTLTNVKDTAIYELLLKSFCVAGDQLIIVLTNASNNKESKIVERLASIASQAKHPILFALPQKPNEPLTHESLWCNTCNSTGSAFYLFNSNEGLYPKKSLNFFNEKLP